MQRRSFFKVGLLGAAGLGLARVGYGPLRACARPVDENYKFKFLTAADQQMLAVLIPVLLKGALAASDQKIEIVKRLDETIWLLPNHQQKELRQLFTLFHINATRALVAGVWTSWEGASEKRIESFLQSFKHSRFDLLRSGYQGLAKLASASFYSDERSWKDIGYDGPPEIS